MCGLLCSGAGQPSHLGAGKLLKSAHVRRLLQQDQNFDGRYSLLDRELGRGRFCVVLKGICKASSNIVAVKASEADQTAESLKCFRNEVLHLEHLEHRNVIRLLDAFDEESMKCIVLDFCNGGDLLQHVNAHGQLDLEEVQCDMTALLSGLQYCHEQKVAHRDLKPENLLVVDGDPEHLRIADFETATYFHTGSLFQEDVGTPGYASPQMMEQRYTKACDAWSSGVICYFLLSSSLPFSAPTARGVAQRVLEGRYEFPDDAWHSVPLEMKEVVSGLLEYEEAERMLVSHALQLVRIFRGT